MTPLTPATAYVRGAMTLRYPAARLLQATNPRHRPLTTLRTFERFAAEVLAEAGPDVLADIVRAVEQHAALSRGRRAA